jgi:[ribosomal protein S18]-alanine N-acetyltransferase
MVGKLWFRRLQEEDARTVASWRYPEPYSAYNADVHDDGAIQAMLNPSHSYHAILQCQETVGYFCLGDDARVPGWQYDDNALDMGMGLRPDLTGRGQGTAFLPAVISHIKEQQPHAVLRATIASWNQRAIRMCGNAGFTVLGTFATTREDRTEFVVMLLSSSA